jgi:hypothetical protein
VLHDLDDELLERALTAPPQATADGPTPTVEARVTDVTRLVPADVAGADLIATSALLDLLTAEELAMTLAVCATARCPMLLALSVLGYVALDPAEPLDARLEAAFNAHQRRPTARGDRRLGPDAVEAAAWLLRATGAAVLVRPSPWQLDAAHAELTAAWLEGWLDAACEQEPALRAPAAGYRDRRLAQLAAGELTVVVDHADLLVLP